MEVRVILNIMKKTALIILVVLLLTACSNPLTMLKGWLGTDEEEASIDVIDTSGQQIGDSELRDTILYYKDENGLLIPVMRKIPWTEGRGIAKEAMKAMVDTEENRQDMLKVGLYPIIPSETQVLGMTIRDGLCKLDLSRQFLNIKDKKEEETIIQSVVYTLTEFPTVDRVQFFIEGETVSNLPHGTFIGETLKRENINFLGQKPAPDTVLVYYENTDSMNPMFVPVTKPIEIVDDVSNTNILDVLDSLMIVPPSESGLQSRIPVNTKVIGVEITDSIAEIYLTEEILVLKGDENLFERAVQSIAFTMKEHYRNLTGIKIFVNGESLKTASGMDVFDIPSYPNQY